MGNQVRFLEAGEVQRLMETPSLKSLTGLRNRCVMGLMYEAGLRTGEVLSLKPRDVVLEEKRVEVRHLRVHGEKAVEVRGPGGSLPALAAVADAHHHAARPAGDPLDLH